MDFKWLSHDLTIARSRRIFERIFTAFTAFIYVLRHYALVCHWFFFSFWKWATTFRISTTTKTAATKKKWWNGRRSGRKMPPKQKCFLWREETRYTYNKLNHSLWAIERAQTRTRNVEFVWSWMAEQSCHISLTWPYSFRFLNTLSANVDVLTIPM